jgi:hypothetical protein
LGALLAEVRELPGANFACPTQVSKTDAQQAKASLAAAGGLPLREDLTHLEGGNVLTGLGKDGHPYALVGKDSVELARRMLQDELGLQTALSDKEMQEIIALDLGIDDPSRVTFVEQPGDFHLDMGMVLLEPGVVAVNDAIMAERLVTPGEKPSKNAVDRKTWEDRAVKDLTDAGLTVVRMPLVFHGKLGTMNFANGELGTDPLGHRYLVTTGGDAGIEDQVRELYAKRGIALHCVPPEASRTSLAAGGGVGCRCKAEVRWEASQKENRQGKNERQLYH